MHADVRTVTAQPSRTPSPHIPIGVRDKQGSDSHKEKNPKTKKGMHAPHTPTKIQHKLAAGV